MVSDWNTQQLSILLYRWAPIEPGYFKIDPGRNAEFWKECLRDGVIAAGWGDAGNMVRTKPSTSARYSEGLL